MKAHLFVRLAISNRPVTYSGGVPCLAVLVLKSQDHRHERFPRWLPSLRVGIGKYESLIVDDFEIDAPVRHFVSVGAAHDDQIRAARPDVKLRNGRRIRQGRKPFLEEFGIGPRLEYLLAWRPDDAGQHKLAIRGRGSVGCGGHGPFSSGLSSRARCNQIWASCVKPHEPWSATS